MWWKCESNLLLGADSLTTLIMYHYCGIWIESWMHVRHSKEHLNIAF